MATVSRGLGGSAPARGPARRLEHSAKAHKQGQKVPRWNMLLRWY